MTLPLRPLVIASWLAFEIISVIPTPAQGFDIPTTTVSAYLSDRPTHVDAAYRLANKLPGRRQGAGSR